MRNRLLFLLGLLAIMLLATLAGGIGGAGAAILLLRQGTVWEAPADAAVTATAQPAVASMDRPATDRAFLEAVRATRPAVVTVLNIQARRAGFFAEPRLVAVGSGSGVIFDPRGYVATNAHVVQGAQAVEVVFHDGRITSAALVKGHLGYDVAILHVEGDLPAVAVLGDSSQLEPGMPVLAIGSPLGTEYQNTVTAGIVAGLGRRVKEQRFDWSTLEYQEMDVVKAPLIQTDAAINSGNSGGPLINSQGQVVGLNTLIVRSDGRTTVEGLGFAIPSNIVRTLANEWIDGIPRPSLGVEFEPLDPMTARERGLTRATGALITQIQRGSTADSAGLRPGDLVVAIDGVALDLDHSLVDLLWRYRAGDTVRLTVQRDGQERDIAVRLGS